MQESFSRSKLIEPSHLKRLNEKSDFIGFMQLFSHIFAIFIVSILHYLEKAYLFQNDRDLSKEVNLSDEDLKKFDFGKYTIQELPSDSIIYDINYWYSNFVLILKNCFYLKNYIY